jgi:hypothetical protein
LGDRKRQGGGITAPQRDRDDLVRLGALQAEERDMAARAERALYVSLRGHHVRVVHASIIAAHYDERLTAGDSGRPFQRSLNEARITGSGESRASESDTESEGDY